MKKFGFTLAEVLITLGVIGVVAAMTMPTLIKEYQKHVWVNQLKKSVSTIENGFKMAMAESGVDKLVDSELYRELYNGNSCHCYMGTNLNANFENKLKEYFKIISIQDINRQDYRFLNGTTAPINFNREILLSDGSSILLINSGPDITQLSSYENSIQELTIDINSSRRGPNQIGRDVFVIGINIRGNVIRGNRYAGACDSNKIVGIDRFDCIVKNGWKMDY